MTPLRLAILALVSLALAASAAGQDWPQWRGPNYDGSTEASGLPTDFSKTKRVIWAAEMPGPGAGTPVLLGNRVFVTSTAPERGQLVVMCLDRESGKTLWKHDASSGYQPGESAGSKIHLHDRSNYASPSPVTDGERVVFFFGNGDLLAYDLDGAKLWSRNLQQDYGDFAFQWTFSASPTLWGDRLYMQILQRDQPVRGIGEEKPESFLLAMDADTGETIYQHVRPSDARMESLESYATPIPYEGSDGRQELLIMGGDVITGHDPESGAELWRWGTWNEGHREMWWRVVPSPVVGAGVVLACAPKRAPIHAVKLGGSGDLGPQGLAWKSEGRRNPITSDVPTPLYYDGAFFVLSDMTETLARVDPESGEAEWTVEMPGRLRWRASPTGADGKIWCMNHGGLVTVHDATSGELIHSTPMGEEDDDFIRATIAIAHNQLFIRSHTRLYCIGAGGSGAAGSGSR